MGKILEILDQLENTEQLKQFVFQEPVDSIDDLTQLAALASECSYAFIALFNDGELSIVSRYGFSLDEFIKKPTILNHALVQNDIFIIEDIHNYSNYTHFLANQKNSYYRFYMGIPLRDKQGDCQGVLCLLDLNQNQVSSYQQKMLNKLSQQIIKNLKTRDDVLERQRDLNILESYRTGLDQHAIIARTDIKGKILFVNQKFCDISQYNEQELIGKDHRIINSGYHSKEFFKNLWETVLAGKTWNAEVCNKAKDGSLYWVDTAILPLKDDKGNILELMAFRYDITDKKTMETLLIQTQKSAHIGAWELDIKTFDTKWTDETYRIHELELGTPTNTVNGISFYAEHEQDRISNLVKDCIEQGKAFSGDFEFITAKGNKKWVQSKGFPIKNEDGNVVKLMGTFQDITEAKLREIELVKVKEELELSVGIAKLGFWSYDLIHNEVHWSKEIFTIFPEDINQGAPSFDKHMSTIHDEDRDRYHKCIEDCMNHGIPYTIVIRTYEKDNPSQIVWAEGKGEAKRNEQGEIIALFGTCQNVTERENYRYELIKQSAILNGVLDDMPFVVWVKDKEQNIITVNQKYADFFGKEKKYFLGKSDKEIFPGEIGQAFYNREKEIFDNQNTVKTENKMERENGTRIYSGLQFPILNDQGICIGTAGMMEDITEEKIREKEYSMILEQTRIGIWKYDPINNILEWDNSMYELYEVSKDDFSGAYDAWVKTLHPDFMESAQIELQNALDGKQDFDTTFSIIAGNGKIRHIGAKAYVDRDQDGKAILMTGINIDKTNEVIAEEKSKESEKLLAQHAKLASLGQMAAGVAHEINNPLAIIAASSEMLTMKSYSEKKIKGLQTKIDRSIERIKNIVSGLKKFSRDSSEIEKNIISINNTIKEVLSLTESKAARLQVPILYEEGADLHVKANEIQIEQILTNLIFNALDETCSLDNPWVKVSTYENNDYCCITIADSGVGINPNVVESLFNPFFTTKEVGKGTGLGLSISLGIAKDHGGDLRYELVDGHTAFTLILPKQIKDQSAA